ncbi:MAG: tetratricopeptide repeat protein [Burkholderiales bacterium]
MVREAARPVVNSIKETALMLAKTLTFILATSIGLGALPAYGDNAQMNDVIAGLQHDWARGMYVTPEDERLGLFSALADTAHRVSAEYSRRAEPLVWEAIIRLSYAKYASPLSALRAAHSARDLLLRAETIDAAALDGSIYTTLGSLYSKMPGWPIGFGDKEKGREYLQKALVLNPQGIDSNYFYADFLMQQGEYAKAAEYFKKGLNAPPRPGREDADEGRRKEIQVELKKAAGHL